MNYFKNFYNEMAKFRKSKLFKEKYNELFNIIGGYPKKSYNLELRLSITGAQLRELIRHARREGHLICSGERGYYITNHWTEFEENIEHLKTRAMSQLFTIAQARRRHSTPQVEMDI